MLETTDGYRARVVWCAVYDTKTGQIVHVHRFIGDNIAADTSEAREARTSAALHQLRDRHALDQLCVVHAPPNEELTPDTALSVDKKHDRLIIERRPLTTMDGLLDAVKRTKEGQTKGGSKRRPQR